LEVPNCKYDDDDDDNDVKAGAFLEVPNCMNYVNMMMIRMM
jgi:hypothetical protein